MELDHFLSRKPVICVIMYEIFKSIMIYDENGL